MMSSSLQKREEGMALRRLRPDSSLIDFCSNDYLGFARNLDLFDATEREFSQLGSIRNGSGGSRLLAGNSDYAEQLEHFLANYHQGEAALLFNSGYDANVGLFAALGQKNTTIIYDELIHASVHDGIRLSESTRFLFRHNDLNHLEERLKLATGTTFVAVESVYSMDGDPAPLSEILILCEKYDAHLIVDEAHATGVFGAAGAGMVQQLGLEKAVFARLHTFGKALGCHGAVIIGSQLLRNYLINFSRSFIYTTALPLKSLVAIHQAYLLNEKSDVMRTQLFERISIFQAEMKKHSDLQLLTGKTPIQCLIVPGNQEVRNLSVALQEKGLDVRPILSPTVPKGKERLRICIHAYNTIEELDSLCAEIVRYFSSKSVLG